MTAGEATGLMEITLAVAKEVFRLAAQPDDDFFDLGADSVSAVMFVAALEERLRVPVSLLEVFEAESVAQFVSRLGQAAELPDATQ
jgi:acyl carrier protein